jgi:two-component system sensor kinase ParS
VRGLFSRVYLGMALVLLVSLACVSVLRPGRPADLPTHVTHLAGASPDRVRARLDEASDPEAEARALGDELGQPITLVPVEALREDVAARLEASLAGGPPWVELGDHGPQVWIGLPAKGLVAQLSPRPPPPPMGGERLAAFAILTLLGAAGIGFALIRPVERQLDAVATAAARIGAGDLSVRAEVTRGDGAGQLAEAFNGMAGQIEEMIARRESLLHGASHELRTPLARLRFALELIELAEDAPDRARRIQEAAADVQELESLVRELLQYSKLEGPRRGSVTTEVTTLRPVLEGLVEDARRVRPDTSLRLQVTGDPKDVGVDRKLFARAVGNLINNAVRYADSEVVVTLTQQGHTLLVLVDDDGPGVPEADRERIFDPFARLDAARSRDTGGTGLGLPIAAGAARAHGGRIVVSDSPLGGARFSWEMPC